MLALKRLTLSFFFSLTVLAGCGSGVAIASGTSSQISVVVAGVSLATIGTPVQFSASIAGSPNTGVIWTVTGASASEDYGTISAVGVYTPPSTVPVHGQIKIVATSQADSSKTSSTAVTITNPTPVITSVNFTAGHHSSFLVDVRGSNFMPASTVLYLGYGWPTTYVSSTQLQFTMTSPPAAGTFVSLGVVTPAPGRTQSSNYSATVPGAVSVSVTGAAQAIVNERTQYTAAVTGTSNTAVTWTLNGSSPNENYGTVSPTGLYTPPSAVPVHGVVTITAISAADTTKSASASVTIANPTPVIAAASLALQPNGSYLVDVKGSNFTPASGAVPGAYGVPTTYVSPTELKFALISPPAPGTQIALSVITPAPGRVQSASYNLVIPGAVSVAVSGASVSTIGTPVRYTASVVGTQDTAVTWKVTGASTTEDYGTIWSSGLYMPPAAVPVHGAITITATSQADMNKSSTANVTITNPTPVIASAALALQQDGSYVVDVKGSNFTPASGALPGAYGVPTTYVSPTELRFALTSPPAPGTQIALSVVTPAPGRAQSASYNLVIPGAVSVVVTGASVSTIGTPVQYTASVVGTQNTAVTWKITGASTTEDYGTISSNGLYMPPAVVPVHGAIAITATSQADTNKSSTASLTITNPTPVITSAAFALQSNGTYVVDVKGSNFTPASGAVPGAYGVPTTYVSPTELKFALTSPPAPGTQIALSVVTPAPGRVQSASYNLVVPGAVGVSVSGADLVTVGTPVQYTASVSGTQSAAVTWTIKGASTSESYGTISSAGLYTPPSSVPSHGLIYISATSQADTTKSGSESVTISNPVPSITAANMTPETHSTFLVDVVGSNFMPASAVLYAGYGVPTTFVSPTHLQFTLSNPPAAGTVVALGVVTPAPGRTQSANFNATIPGLVSVTIAGAAQATVGAPVQYTASVTGTSNAAVTWKISGPSTQENYGTISGSGLYSPPATVPGHAVLTITATSAVDTTKCSSVTVSLFNAVPAIAAATTTTATNGAVLIDVKGSNFIPSSYVQYSGYGLATTYVSPTELTASIPQTTAAGLTQGSSVVINAVTPNPGKTQSTDYSVQLPGKVVVVVTGSGMVGSGETSQYVATVSGTSNTAVKWSVRKADGSDPGTITSTGLYTPPDSIRSNTAVTVTATSEAAPTSTGSAAVSLVTVTASAAARLLDQSSFGPTDSSIAHVQTIGLSNYIDEQIAMVPTLLPINPAQAFCANSVQVCNDENWWNNAVTAPDQLRQRVSNALSEILVVAYRDVNSATVPPYQNMLTANAFGSWPAIMKGMTLSPAMGEFLNMMNSGKPAAGAIANENFARENMQLFNLGLNMLNQDGTLQTDSSGNPIPTYTEAQIEAFSRAFTGWTAPPLGNSKAVFPNYNMGSLTQMVAFDSAHDMAAKVLLNSTLPAGQTAEQDLDGAIQDVFNHPNVGPFITKQLIQHLVKSNPSPAYVGRIAAVFANDGTGVRGNLGAVVKAILLDTEARAGDTAPVANDGYLREPILWVANVLRALNAVPKPGVTDNSAYTAIDSFASSQQQRVFDPSTVFNFYPADYDLAGTTLSAPQFALETSATILQKLTLASEVVDNEVGKLGIDLSYTSPLGVLATASDGLMLDELNKLFLHGSMSAPMRSTIEAAISGVPNPAQRVRTAVYLVITSSQYKVIH